MSIKVTCDGCGKVEEPRRNDICEITYDLGGSTVIRDFCAGCEQERLDQINKK